MWQHKVNLAYAAFVVLAIVHQMPQTQAALQCLQCDSVTDPNCNGDLSKITPKDCTDDTFKFCTTSIDANGKVSRACAVDSTTCTAPNCLFGTENKHIICKTCDSTNDADCSQTDGSKATNTICPATATQCLINVKTDKQLERKCATAENVNACTNEDTCKKCSTGNCNVGIFPTKRVRCYQCASTDTKCANPATNTDTIVSKPCRLYTEDDKCYTFGTSDTSMTRGCVSDTDTNVNKCSTPDSNEACSTCTADNCNDSTYERVQKLKCVQCTSSKDDTKCLWGQEATSAKDCQKKIQYNKLEQCYTQSKDGTVYRGCIYDREAALGDCKSETGCETCASENGCNNKSTTFSCIRCRSDEEKKCQKEAKDLTGGNCRNVVTEAEASCFYGTWNNVVIRGCLVDADAQMQAICTDDKNKQCTACKGKDCNTDSVNGASSMTVTAGLLTAVLLVLWRLN